MSKNEDIEWLEYRISEVEDELCAKCTWCSGRCEGINHLLLKNMKEELKKLKTIR